MEIEHDHEQEQEQEVVFLCIRMDNGKEYYTELTPVINPFKATKEPEASGGIDFNPFK